MAIPFPIPLCQGFPIDGCVLAFARELQALIPPQKTPITGGIQAVIDALRAEQARILAIKAGFQAALTAASAKIAEYKAKIAGIGLAIDKIDNFLARFPCPELDPLKILLQLVKAYYEALLALISLGPLQSLLNQADVDLDALACHIDNLQNFVDNIN